MGMDCDASGLRNKIERIKANAVNAKKAAGIAFLTVAQQTIISGGNGWAPWKQLPKRPHQMLWDTGTLLRSLADGGDGNILQHDGDTITIGTNVAYAAAQNYGYPERNLPARPFLVVNDQSVELATQAFMKALLQGVT